MGRENLNLYRCLCCRSDKLVLKIGSQGDDGRIEEGSIECLKCSSVYNIYRGLPRFVTPQNYADSFGFQWCIHSKTQLDSFSKLAISRERVFEVTRWSPNLHGERVLEAGSGAGRFTEVLLSTGAEVVSFDYSTAVEANYKNNGANKNLTLFQGYIYNIPLDQASYDKVFCLGVLQHTPNPSEAFANLARYVRPGGFIAVDVYRRDVFACLQWKYILRPITKRINKQILYGLIERITPLLIPVTKFLRKFAGRAGARLMPIVEYSHLGLPPELNRQWAILDTFDMYSPAYDRPQSLVEVRSWFELAGFVEIDVRKGPNGIVGVGKKPD